jgi:monofunctional biosynthetic peptidoglycan transglycosylase
MKRWIGRLAAAAFLALLVLSGVTAAVVLALRSLRPPTSAFMWISHRADPATGLPCAGVEYEWVDAERISPYLALAVVVAEDQRFFEHRGFDFRSMERALDDAVDEGRIRGASTLTQQLAKNLFLWPGKSVLRKAVEVWPTLWMEWLLSKDRILELYLNVAQFGPCVFGAEAASQRYFERPAAELEPEQAALLATVLPNPSRLRAWNPGPYAQQRREQVLALMLQHRSLRQLGR